MKYDVVIIGSGLGGLLCGTILSKEGYSVCILEKNPKIGGCLQSMRRRGCVFNTGVHYMGSLDEGQVLNRYFKYFGLDGALNIQRFDEKGFDIVGFDDGTEYPIAMDDYFVDVLSQYFPEERQSLTRYREKLKEVCSSMPFYSFDSTLYGDSLEKPYLGTGAAGYVSELIQNKRLRQILFGNDLLYGGISDKTSLLLYSLINHSYIRSAWHMSGDSEDISRNLAEQVYTRGGSILCNHKAHKFVPGDNKISAVKLDTGEEIEGTYFISNLHPQSTVDMTEPGMLKKAYIKRIENLKQTPGFFILFLVLKENSFPYHRYNYHHYNENGSWPRKYVIAPVGSGNNGYAKAVSLMALMDYDEVRKWEGTTIGQRGTDYQFFKENKASKLIELVDKKYPGFKESIVYQYTSTPLTYHDYTGTPDGSAYGVLKDCNQPLASMVFPRTGIPNLLLTGQNVYFHGVLGVSIGAVATCSELLGVEYMLNRL